MALLRHLSLCVGLLATTAPGLGATTSAGFCPPGFCLKIKAPNSGKNDLCFDPATLATHTAVSSESNQYIPAVACEQQCANELMHIRETVARAPFQHRVWNTSCDFSDDDPILGGIWRDLPTWLPEVIPNVITSTDSVIAYFNPRFVSSLSPSTHRAIHCHCHCI
jgi:hypothetical protein